MAARDRWPADPKLSTIGWLRKMAAIGRVYTGEDGRRWHRSPYRDAWEVVVRVGDHHRLAVEVTLAEEASLTFGLEEAFSEEG